LESRLRDSELASSVASLVSAADHLSELITELNRLACADGPIIEPTSMDQVIARALERAGERLGGRPMLDVVGPAESTLVETDRELLADALSELIVNAEEAGSTEKVRIEVQSQAGLGRLYLRVADKGHGMSERAMKHAFDPFFSEKPAGRQRGLGLARARRCVELLGGRIWLERSEGGGIVATIELETAPPAASAA
ncbi:MAG: sensor histidine kinase, partial [Planctomycetota bacterium]